MLKEKKLKSSTKADQAFVSVLRCYSKHRQKLFNWHTLNLNENDILYTYINICLDGGCSDRRCGVGVVYKVLTN